MEKREGSYGKKQPYEGTESPGHIFVWKIPCENLNNEGVPFWRGSDRPAKNIEGEARSKKRKKRNACCKSLPLKNWRKGPGSPYEAHNPQNRKRRTLPVGGGKSLISKKWYRRKGEGTRWKFTIWQEKKKRKRAWPGRRYGGKRSNAGRGASAYRRGRSLKVERGPHAKKVRKDSQARNRVTIKRR